ncbi:MAG TPA: hypothetical protein VGJ48_25080 [Pyrinomonadaceae bacterium]
MTDATLNFSRAVQLQNRERAGVRRGSRAGVVVATGCYTQPPTRSQKLTLAAPLNYRTVSGSDRMLHSTADSLAEVMTEQDLIKAVNYVRNDQGEP